MVFLRFAAVEIELRIEPVSVLALRRIDTAQRHIVIATPAPVEENLEPVVGVQPFRPCPIAAPVHLERRSLERMEIAVQSAAGVCNIEPVRSSEATEIAHGFAARLKDAFRALAPETDILHRKRGGKIGIDRKRKAVSGRPDHRHDFNARRLAKALKLPECGDFLLAPGTARFYRPRSRRLEKHSIVDACRRSPADDALRERQILRLAEVAIEAEPAERICRPRTRPVRARGAFHGALVRRFMAGRLLKPIGALAGRNRKHACGCKKGREYSIHCPHS